MTPTATAKGAPWASNLAGAFTGGLAGLIFDCDGVLFDSQDANTAYYNHILLRLGLPPLDEADAAYAHMASTTEALRRVVPEHRWPEAEEVRQAASYATMFLSAMKPMPRMREFLEAARRTGLRMAMCTNRSASVDNVLRYHGLDGFFHPVMTISDVAPKPAPEGLLAIIRDWNVPRHDVGYIGDSPVDQQAAEAADMPFFSFRNENLRARLYLNGFDDLFEILDVLKK